MIKNPKALNTSDLLSKAVLFNTFKKSESLFVLPFPKHEQCLD